MSFILKSVAVATTILAMSGAFAQQGETVKIAWIDPLTGLMGPVGNNQLNTWKFMADEFNKKNPAGVKFEVIGLDNKLSPAESLTALKAALDQGARYIAQGNGSSVAGALIEAVDKHNQRNPGKEVIFLNYAAVDPDFTNSKCSDLALMIKAANEGGYTGKFNTYHTGVTGTPTALGTGGAGRVYQISYSHHNLGGQMSKWVADFKAKYNDDLYTGSVPTIFNVLSTAMAKAKSTDPVKVAAAMAGLKVANFNGEVEMRKTDHQLQQPLFMTVWQKTDAKHPYSAENTGMTLAPVKEYPSFIASTPTSCQMKRPG